MANARGDSDNRADDIEIMIANENDPKARALLILLNNINHSLLANTATIVLVSDKLDKHLILFEEHAKADAEMTNKGKGAWKVLAWVIGVAQAIGVAVWIDAKTDLQGVQTAIITDIISHSKLDSRITVLEKK